MTGKEAINHTNKHQIIRRLLLSRWMAVFIVGVSYHIGRGKWVNFKYSFASSVNDYNLNPSQIFTKESPINKIIDLKIVWCYRVL